MYSTPKKKNRLKNHKSIFFDFLMRRMYTATCIYNIYYTKLALNKLKYHTLYHVRNDCSVKTTHAAQNRAHTIHKTYKYIKALHAQYERHFFFLEQKLRIANNKPHENELNAFVAFVAVVARTNVTSIYSSLYSILYSYVQVQQYYTCD